MCCGILCKLIAYVLSGLGIAAIIIGAVLGFAVLPNKISDEVERQVRLEYNTEQFERWRILPFTQQMKVHYFTISNIDAVERDGAVPEVVERGPYVYDLSREKQNIGRHPNDDTLTYNEYLQFRFNEQASGNNRETDVLRMFNSPLLSTLQRMEGRQTVSNDEILAAFPMGLFPQISVGDFLFNGFRFCDGPAATSQICSQGWYSGDHFQLEVNAITFAFLRHRRDEHDGTYEISAGIDSIQDLGSIRRWNGFSILPDDIWGTTGQCRNIRGRDSTIFPPNIQRRDNFDIFYTDICRVVTLEHVGNEDFNEIPGQRREFLASTLNNDGNNDCFCTGSTRTLDGVTNACWPNGFMDLFTCTGVHLLLSYPHFLGASGATINTVRGLEPDTEEHGSYTIIEPGTGTPLKIVRRFQYNMALRPIPGILLTNTLPRALLPLLWVEETMELPQNLVDRIRDDYLAELETVTIITWVLIGGGIALFIASLLLKILCC